MTSAARKATKGLKFLLSLALERRVLPVPTGPLRGYSMRFSRHNSLNVTLSRHEAESFRPLASLSSALIPADGIVADVGGNVGCYALWLARNAVQAAMKADGIATAVHYPMPLNRQPEVADPDVTLPQGDRAAAEVLSLPMYPDIDADSQARVVEALAGALCAGTIAPLS